MWIILYGIKCGSDSESEALVILVLDVHNRFCVLKKFGKGRVGGAREWSEANHVNIQRIYLSKHEFGLAADKFRVCLKK